MEITSFVAAAISAPRSNNANPICDTAEPARRHLPFSASPKMRILASRQKVHVNVSRIYMALLYIFVKYTMAAVKSRAMTNEASVEAQNLRESVFLYLRNCVKAVSSITTTPNAPCHLLLSGTTLISGETLVPIRTVHTGIVLVEILSNLATVSTTPPIQSQSRRE